MFTPPYGFGGESPSHAFYDIKVNNNYYEHYGRYNLSTREVNFYARYLLQKAMSAFEWTIPDTWDLNYWLYSLYVNGFICVTEIEPFGVIPQICTIKGFNIFYNPSECLIVNPYLDEKEHHIKLGENGELVYLSPDLCGIMDCVYEYAEMLANATCAVNCDLYNSRLSYMFYAKNKAQAESLKKMYDEVGTGAPAIFIDKNLFADDGVGNIIPPMEPFNANLSGNYIASNILEDIRRIEHMFAQKMGLPNANSEKKERLNVDETNKTDDETMANVVVWEDTLNKCIDKVKELYPDISLSFKYRYFNEDEEDSEAVNISAYTVERTRQGGDKQQIPISH